MINELKFQVLASPSLIKTKSCSGIYKVVPENKVLIIVFVLSVLLIQPVNGQWTNDLNENTAVSLFTGLPTLVPGNDNSIIVFSQSRDVQPLLRAQRIGVNGTILWPGPQGVRISTAKHAQWLRDFSGLTRFVLPDGEDGAYIAYRVGRIIGELPEVGEVYATSAFVQRLDRSGDRLFGPEGLRLMPILPDTFNFSQEILDMIPDDVGGVYVLWWIAGPEFTGVYINRINKNGNLLWENIKLASGISNAYIPYLDENSNLNLYEYPGETDPPGFYPDRFLKITADSGTIISQKTIEIGAGEFGFSTVYDYTSSTNGTAIFVFHDFRGDTLRAQKLDGDSNKLWGEEPIILATNLIRSSAFEVFSDHHGGAYLWYQAIDATLHVLHLDDTGTISWQKQFTPEMLGDFARRIGPYANRPVTTAKDGSIFILLDGFQVVTKFSFSGDKLWETRISNRASIASSVDDFSVLADIDGGCTVVWEEVGSFVGLRAQRVDRLGNLGGTTPVNENSYAALPNEFQLENPNPNPFRDTVKISFSVPQNAAVELKIYNLLGKEVITLKSEKLPGGSHSIYWDGMDKTGQKLAAGIYVVILSNDRYRLTRKIILLR